MKTQAVARLLETSAQSAEFNRLRDRLKKISEELKKLEGKTDKSSATKRAKLLEDQKVSRAQKKKLAKKD